MWVFILAGIPALLAILAMWFVIAEDEYEVIWFPMFSTAIAIALFLYALDSRSADIDIRHDLTEQGFTILTVDGQKREAVISRKDKKFNCNVRNVDDVWVILKAKNCKEIGNVDPKKDALKPEGLDGEKK